MAKYFAESELIINEDGSCFHLHLRPEQVADKVILVGDPGRVALVASHFEEKECEVSSREFHAITGTYKGKRITVQSTGIGCDNIDIVVNELDALANVDFETRTVKKNFRQLSMVRIGTSGSIQEDIPVGSMVIARKALGIDGAFHFYKNSEKVRDIELEDAFISQSGWKPIWNHPYIVDADEELANRICCEGMVMGITITANGFYGPQGRELRLEIADKNYGKMLSGFEYKGQRLTNFEMESAMLQGLAKLMGHKAVTVCSIIAGRVSHTSNPNYKGSIGEIIQLVLNKL